EKLYLASSAVATLLKEPPSLPKRPVESASSSFSPASPMSLPSVKPNMCSVSTSPALSARLPGPPCAEPAAPSSANTISSIARDSAPSGVFRSGKAGTDQPCKNIVRHPVEIQTHARGHGGRAQDDSDQRRGFRRPFEQDRIGACERGWRRGNHQHRDKADGNRTHGEGKHS